MIVLNKKKLIQRHKPAWAGFGVWVLMFSAFIAAQLLLFSALVQDIYWLIPPLTLVVAYLMHSHLLAFHEAAHGTLCPDKRINDAVGIFIGALSLVPFSLYRAVHHYHHAFLASERDEELWPFVIPGYPRWARILSAFSELTVGVIYTPWLFMRAFVRTGSTIQSEVARRRIWNEYGLSVLFLGMTLAVAIWLNTANYLIVLYLLPAWLAGNLQTWRKYIEHVGLTGSTVLGSTRSIVPRSRMGRANAAMLFNEPYHGVHHKYARLPQAALPEFVEILSSAEPSDPPLYPSYRSALPAMLRSLRDPRVGAQWLHASTR